MILECKQHNWEKIERHLSQDKKRGPFYIYVYKCKKCSELDEEENKDKNYRREEGN